METVSREALEPWYVTGFAEGAASFTYSRSGRQHSLYFSAKLAAADDALLVALQGFFAGAGRIYQVASRDARMYRVSRMDQLGHVVEHFDAFPLRGSKAAAYQIWREMYLLKQGFRDRQRDYDRLEQLALALSATSRRDLTAGGNVS